MAVQRGEVYFVNLDPAIGREQKGRRPVLVLSRNSINNMPLVVTVVPGTSGANVVRDYPQNVRVPAGEANLPEETVFMAFQIRALDHRRFVGPPEGTVSATTLARVEQAVAWVLELP
jgi:mRNA interferase MazF